MQFYVLNNLKNILPSLPAILLSDISLKKNTYLLFLCLCARMSAHVCESRCACLCAGMGARDHLSCCPFRQGHSLACSSSTRMDWLARQSKALPVSVSPEMGLQVHTCVQYFQKGSEDQGRFSDGTILSIPLKQTSKT